MAICVKVNAKNLSRIWTVLLILLLTAISITLNCTFLNIVIFKVFLYLLKNFLFWSLYIYIYDTHTHSEKISRSFRRNVSRIFDFFMWCTACMHLTPVIIFSRVTWRLRSTNTNWQPSKKGCYARNAARNDSSSDGKF